MDPVLCRRAAWTPACADQQTPCVNNGTRLCFFSVAIDQILQSLIISHLGNI